MLHPRWIPNWGMRSHLKIRRRHLVRRSFRGAHALLAWLQHGIVVASTQRALQRQAAT